MGLSSGSTVMESLFHPGFQDVLEFLRQCTLPDPNQVCLRSTVMVIFIIGFSFLQCIVIFIIVLQTTDLEEALCSHYKVPEVKCLGHGSINTLCNALSKQQRGTSKDTCIVYEAAVCSRARYFY